VETPLDTAYRLGADKAYSEFSFQKLSNNVVEDAHGGILGMWAAGGAQLAGQGLSHRLSDKANQAVAGELVPLKERVAILDAMGLKDKSFLHTVDETMGAAFGLPDSAMKGHTPPLDGIINLSPLRGEGAAGSFAHEAGHATMVKPGLLNKLRRGSMRTFYRHADLLGGAAALATLFSDSDTENPYLVPALLGGLQAPRIIEEGIASTKALKAMKRTGLFNKEQIRAARGRLGRAGLTYLLPGLALAATPSLVRYGQRNYKD